MNNTQNMIQMDMTSNISKILRENPEEQETNIFSRNKSNFNESEVSINLSHQDSFIKEVDLTSFSKSINNKLGICTSNIQLLMQEDNNLKSPFEKYSIDYCGNNLPMKKEL